MTKTTVHTALLTLFAAAALTTPSAEARITRIEITRIESPTFEGRSFGTVGPYEKLVGRAYGEIDPTDHRNAVIVDVEAAPARTYDEVAATKTMIKRTDERLGLKPKRVAADTAYGDRQVPQLAHR